MKKDELLLDLLRSVLGKYELSPFIMGVIRFFFRNPYESLTVIDRNMRIHFMDKASEKFLGLAEGGAKGLDITEIVPTTRLSQVIETGMPICGRILEVRDKKMISVLYPIKQEGKIIGAIGRIVFQSLEEIDRVNKEIQELKEQIHCLKEKTRDGYKATYTFNNILGNSISIKKAIETAKRISLLDVDVLIYGESGTGKELFAHSIHNYAHPSQPFVKINCTSIPFELAESELFGYEKGAFTGASPLGKPGSFEMAHNGTVFLDEVASLPLSIQAKLLRVLQEREVARLGSTKQRKIKFRPIITTNVDLERLGKEGGFREDFYYRVAKTIIRLPPLRERKEDIPVYLNHFLEKINKSFKTNIYAISREAMEILLRYDWPGNVRELINILEQTAIKAWDSVEITENHLPPHILFYTRETNKEDSFSDEQGINQKITHPTGKQSIKREIAKKEKELIVSALKQMGGNKRKAAMFLSMPRSTIYKKLKTYNIEISGKKTR
jgi:transcriptional regulator with PAS, ATPase and Fis domain